MENLEAIPQEYKLLIAVKIDILLNLAFIYSIALTRFREPSSCASERCTEGLGSTPNGFFYGLIDIFVSQRTQADSALLFRFSAARYNNRKSVSVHRSA